MVPDVNLGQFARQRLRSLREGELGAMPIIVGIIIIAIYFQARNSQFLTAGNFVNLLAQMSAVTIIGMGIVFVLLLGEIDLSVGYVSGMGGTIAAVLLEPGKGIPTSVAVALALGAGLAIGLLNGFFVAKIGVPSFVVTLAGLLGWQGVQLQIIGSSGTIVIQNSFINGKSRAKIVLYEFVISLSCSIGRPSRNSFTVSAVTAPLAPSQTAVMALVVMMTGWKTVRWTSFGQPRNWHQMTATIPTRPVSPPSSPLRNPIPMSAGTPPCTGSSAGRAR